MDEQTATLDAAPEEMLTADADSYFDRALGVPSPLSAATDESDDQDGEVDTETDEDSNEDGGEVAEPAGPTLAELQAQLDAERQAREQAERLAQEKAEEALNQRKNVDKWAHVAKRWEAAVDAANTEGLLAELTALKNGIHAVATTDDAEKAKSQAEELGQRVDQIGQRVVGDPGAQRFAQSVGEEILGAWEKLGLAADTDAPEHAAILGEYNRLRSNPALATEVDRNVATLFGSYQRALFERQRLGVNGQRQAAPAQVAPAPAPRVAATVTAEPTVSATKVGDESPAALTAALARIEKLEKQIKAATTRSGLVADRGTSPPKSSKRLDYDTTDPDAFFDRHFARHQGDG